MITSASHIHHDVVVQWPLWTWTQAQRGFLSGVTVAGCGALLVGLLTDPFPTTTGPVLLLLAAISIAHIEITRGADKLRQCAGLTHRAHCPPGLTMAWGLAGIVVAADSWAVLCLVVAEGWRFLRTNWIPGQALQLSIYARAVYVVSALTAVAVLDWAAIWVGGSDVQAVLAVAAALLVFAIVSATAIGAALHALEQVPWRQLMSQHEFTAEAVTLSIGAVVGMLLSAGNPWLVLFMFPVVICLHRAVGSYEAAQACEVDARTGLRTAAGWYRAVRRGLRRAERQHQAFAVLVLMVDDARAGTSAHGSSAELMAELPSVLRRRLDSRDVLGWTAHDQLGVLLNDPDLIEATVRTLTAAVDECRTFCSDAQHDRWPAPAIGSARFPDDGGTMEDLLDRAHRAARVAATATARNQAQAEGEHRSSREQALERYRTARCR